MITEEKTEKFESFDTFEEAYESVQGTKVKLVMQHKKFLDTAFDLNDLFAVADAAIWKAWQEWDPKTSKFNTFAHNHIKWAFGKFLRNMNTRFKINAATSYELSNENETYQKIKEVGKTNSEEFNTMFGLDGSEEAKEKFNRDIWNEYIRFQTSQRRPIHVKNASAYITTNNEDDESDTVLDRASAMGDQYNGEDVVKVDGFTMPVSEFEDQMKKLDEEKQKVTQMILEGKSISEMAKEFGLTKVQFMKKFTEDEQQTEQRKTVTRRKAKQGIKSKKKLTPEQLEFLEKQKQKKLQREAEPA